MTALVRATGATLWQLREDAKVESSPVVSATRSYFGATDGRLFALDVADGQDPLGLRHGRADQLEPVDLRLPRLHHDLRGLGLLPRRRNGQAAVEHYISRDSFRYESFYASPSTDGTRIFTLARSGKVVALGARTGRCSGRTRSAGSATRRPRSPTGASSPAASTAGCARYNASSGRALWRAYVAGRILAPALVVGDLVFFSTLERKTYAARVSDGRIVWKQHRQVRAGHRDRRGTTTSRSTGCSSLSRPSRPVAATRAARDGAAKAVSASARQRPPARADGAVALEPQPPAAARLRVRERRAARSRAPRAGHRRLPRTRATSAAVISVAPVAEARRRRPVQALLVRLGARRRRCRRSRASPGS